MSHTPHLKRQKVDESEAVQQAKEHLGSAYDVVLNHEPSPPSLSMSLNQLIFYFVRMEGYEPGSLWWEPKLIKPKPYDTDYSDDPSLRKLFMMLPHEKITRILDNLYAVNQDMYHLLKRLLTGAPLALLEPQGKAGASLALVESQGKAGAPLALLEPQGKACQESDDTVWTKLKRLLTGASQALLDPQGKACQESDDTVWTKWVNAQIKRLPETWETSLTSFHFELGFEKELAIHHHQPSTAYQLTPQDGELLCEFYYESRSSSGRLGIIYPKNQGMLSEFFSTLSVEQFIHILDMFHTLNAQFYNSFKRILELEGSREDLEFYWAWVRSFSSLPLYQGKLKNSHVSILENHQPALPCGSSRARDAPALPCGAPFNKVKSLVVLSEPRSSRARDALGKEIQLSPSDYPLLAKFREQDWYKPPLCASGQFPVVKSEVMCLVNSLPNDKFHRILDIFSGINPSLYESFKRMLTNQETMDDHRIYDQALRRFPTRP